MKAEASEFTHDVELSLSRRFFEGQWGKHGVMHEIVPFRVVSQFARRICGARQQAKKMKSSNGDTREGFGPV